MMGKRKRSGSWSKGDDCGAKKSDDGDSQEEMDSDLFIPKTSTHVRYSARVQEKQEKLRREASPSKQIVDVLCPAVCPPTTSTSVNVVCKGKNDESCLPTSESLPEGGMIHEGSPGKRKKRTWELWSQYDKQLFFEALNEFGKDFDAIQTHLASKLKAKTKTIEPTQIKKKEQVRHFYYRTWNKIQKYLHFPKDMKKAFQELYGLVNYGELRKKQRALNGKTAAKLLELVEKGSTTIKVKGKTLRIKTPVCQALKKINNLTDVEPTKVPSKVVVELLPKDGGAWSVVQCLSHNPRLRSLVMLQRTLASIIVFLEERWKSSSDRIKEQMLETFGKRTRRLRIIPSFKRDSSVPVFKAYETTSSAKISLNAFSRNVLNKDTRDGCVKLVENRKRKKSGSVGGLDGANDSVAEVDWSDAEVTQETKEAGSYNSVATQLFRNAFGDDTLEVKGMSKDEVQRMLQSIYDMPQNASQDEDELDNGDGDNYLDSDECPLSGRMNSDNPGCSCTAGEDKGMEPEEVFSTSIDEEILRRGWTAEEAGSLTVGEVYMLVGHNEKLSFEYEWDEGDEDSEINTRTRIMLERLVLVARNLKRKKQSRHKILTCPPGASSTCPCCGHQLSGTNSPAVATSTSPANTELIGSGASTATAPVGNIRSPNSPLVSNKNVSIPVVTSNLQSVLLQSPATTAGMDGTESSISNLTNMSTATTAPLSIVTPANGINATAKECDSNLSKVKKITPTMVSPSCTGAILSSAPPTAKGPDFSETPTLPAPSPARDVKEEAFKVPTTSGNINGSIPTVYPRIRPMPSNASGENSEDVTAKSTKNAPKPFLDLPKGNRRLGRPCCKKNIVPRYLPLLPKTPDLTQQSPVWEIVGNKSAAVHTVLVNNATPIVLPVTCLNPASVTNGSSTSGGSTVNTGDKEEIPSVAGSDSGDVPMSTHPLMHTSIPVAQSNEGTPSLISESSDNQISSSNFQDLLQVSGMEQGKAEESNLSLSSFMDISLPESTRNVANECLKSEKFLDVTLGSSSCSLSLSNFLNNDSNNDIDNAVQREKQPTVESLKTPKKSDPSDPYKNSSSSSNLLANDHQWLGTDANDLSLGSLLGNLDPAQPIPSETELNFQSMIDDSNNHLDFTSKFSELVAELENSNNNKK